MKSLDELYREQYGVADPLGRVESQGAVAIAEPETKVEHEPMRLSDLAEEQEKQSDTFTFLNKPFTKGKLEPNLRTLVAVAQTAFPFVALPGLKTKGTEEFQERLGRNVVAGVGGMAGSTLQGLRAVEVFFGLDTPVGKEFEKLGNNLVNLSSKVSPRNPDFFDKVVQGATSMAMFIPTGIVGGVVGVGVKSLSMATKIPRIIAWSGNLAKLSGLGMAALAEAEIEAGQTYGDLKRSGKSDIDAADASFGTFWKNFFTIGLTNYIGGKFTSKLIQPGIEGFQEGIQNVIQSVEKKEPIKWGEVAEAIGLGTLIAGGVGPLIEAATIDDVVEVEKFKEDHPVMGEELAGKELPVNKEVIKDALGIAETVFNASKEEGKTVEEADTDAMQAFTEHVKFMEDPDKAVNENVEEALPAPEVPALENKSTEVIPPQQNVSEIYANREMTIKGNYGFEKSDPNQVFKPGQTVNLDENITSGHGGTGVIIRVDENGQPLDILSNEFGNKQAYFMKDGKIVTPYENPIDVTPTAEITPLENKIELGMAKEEGAGRSIPPEKAPQRSGENRLFHGTSKKAAEIIRKEGLKLSSEHGEYGNTMEEYVSLTKDFETAKRFAENTGMNVDLTKPGESGEVIEIDPTNLRIADGEKYPQGKNENWTDYLERMRKEGFDAIDLSKVNADTGENEVALINPQKAKLIDFNQPTPAESGGPAEPPPPSKPEFGKAPLGTKATIRQATGQFQPEEPTITEAQALKEKLKAEEKAAKEGFKEGRETGIEEVKSAKQILDRRRAFIRAVQEDYGLSDSDLKQLTHRDIRLMNNYEFKKFLDDIDARGAVMEKKRELKIKILSEINEKELVKTDNLRKYLKFPSLENMTVDQLNQFNQELENTQKGDEFLSVRKLGTVKNTELAGIKTIREAKEILAKRLGVPLSEVENIRVGSLDKIRFDTQLSEQNPFYKFLVDETNMSILDSEQRFFEMEKEIDDLTKKARSSRKRDIVEKFVPSDETVFKYLESDPVGKSEITKGMTDAELDLANYLQSRFSQFRDILIQHGVLTKYRSDYITHIRRGFLETWKEDGLLTAFKEVFKQYQEDAAVFKILEDDTQNILPLEKFFQFAMQRSGELKPSMNVAKAFKAYAKAFLKKQALDKIVPALDIYAYSLSPKQTTPRGLQMDRRLIKFVHEWINNKKGRRSSLGGILPQGGALDIVLRSINSFVTMIDLGFNIPISLTSLIGEQVTTYTNIGTKKYAKGIARINTEKGREIIENNRDLIGKSAWEDLQNTADDIGDTLSKGMYYLFGVSTTEANKVHLLGSMTDAEWERGELTQERKAELIREIGRYRHIPGARSIFGSTSVGGALTKYKNWALPILRTTTKNLATLIEMAGKGKANEIPHSKEFQELLRETLLTAFIALAGRALIGDDDKDESFIGEMIKKGYRESLTLLGALDPTVLSSVRLLKFLGDLSSAVKSIGLFEEYKNKPGYKGVNRLIRTLTPKAIKPFIPEGGKTRR